MMPSFLGTEAFPEWFRMQEGSECGSNTLCHFVLFPGSAGHHAVFIFKVAIPSMPTAELQLAQWVHY